MHRKVSKVMQPNAVGLEGRLGNQEQDGVG